MLHEQRLERRTLALAGRPYAPARVPDTPALSPHSNGGRNAHCRDKRSERASLHHLERSGVVVKGLRSRRCLYDGSCQLAFAAARPCRRMTCQCGAVARDVVKCMRCPDVEPRYPRRLHNASGSCHATTDNVLSNAQLPVASIYERSLGSSKKGARTARRSCAWHCKSAVSVMLNNAVAKGEQPTTVSPSRRPRTTALPASRSPRARATRPRRGSPRQPRRCARAQ